MRLASKTANDAQLGFHEYRLSPGIFNVPEQRVRATAAFTQQR